MRGCGREVMEKRIVRHWVMEEGSFGRRRGGDRGRGSGRKGWAGREGVGGEYAGGMREDGLEVEGAWGGGNGGIEPHRSVPRRGRSDSQYEGTAPAVGLNTIDYCHHYILLSVPVYN